MLIHTYKTRLHVTMQFVQILFYSLKTEKKTVLRFCCKYVMWHVQPHKFSIKKLLSLQTLP